MKPSPAWPPVRPNHCPRWLARLIIHRWGNSGLGVFDVWGALRTAQRAVQEIRPAFNWNRPGSMRLAGGPRGSGPVVFVCEHYVEADRLAFALEYIARNIGCGWAVMSSGPQHLGVTRGFLFEYSAAAIVGRMIHESGTTPRGVRMRRTSKATTSASVEVRP